MSWDNVLAWWCRTLHGRPGTLKSILGWQMILWFLYGLQKIDCSTRRSLWGWCCANYLSAAQNEQFLNCLHIAFGD